ncbi:MAG: hypothetical protein R3D28_00580 [Geminicoccaceae bacterium]
MSAATMQPASHRDRRRHQELSGGHGARRRHRHWPAQVVGLIGENGAGKVDPAEGAERHLPARPGRGRVAGKPVQIRSPRDAFDHGIAMVFKNSPVFSTLSVAENIFLAREASSCEVG